MQPECTSPSSLHHPLYIGGERFIPADHLRQESDPGFLSLSLTACWSYQPILAANGTALALLTIPSPFIIQRRREAHFGGSPLPAGGWFRTGDLGYFDDRGNLWLSGRLKDIVRSGSENVAAAEVERVPPPPPPLPPEKYCRPQSMIITFRQKEMLTDGLVVRKPVFPIHKGTNFLYLAKPRLICSSSAFSFDRR
jgi:acyl-CoA synthetase (AMP-forming)/AMP-acid ligase II